MAWWGRRMVSYQLKWPHIASAYPDAPKRPPFQILAKYWAAIPLFPSAPIVPRKADLWSRRTTCYLNEKVPTQRKQCSWMSYLFCQRLQLNLSGWTHWDKAWGSYILFSPKYRNNLILKLDGVLSLSKNFYLLFLFWLSQQPSEAGGKANGSRNKHQNFP